MILAALFFLTALFYASVGFGGGSSYLAILSTSGQPYYLIPVLALICNIAVVSGNCFHTIRAGFLRPKLSVVLTLSSIPMAFLGGSLHIDETHFKIILATVLFCAGAHMLWQSSVQSRNSAIETYSTSLLVFTGAALGLLAGIVGIGGGIFLAPILYYLQAAKPKEIACTCSIFILLNSLAGLLGQLGKLGLPDELAHYWHLILAVLLGGQAGNMGLTKGLSPKAVKILTAIFVLFAAGRIGFHLTF